MFVLTTGEHVRVNQHFRVHYYISSCSPAATRARRERCVARAAKHIVPMALKAFRKEIRKVFQKSRKCLIR